MVAVVLLIAFTVGIGGLVSIFVTGLTTTSTGVTQNQSLGLSRCASGWINVNRVTNSTVFYQNPTSQTITGLVIIMSDGSQNVNPADPSLTLGEANFTYIGNTSANTNSAGVSGVIPGGASGNTSVTVRGLCQSTVTVEGRCARGQDCWEAG